VERKQLAVTCPVCGRKNEFLVSALTEGSVIACPLCKVKLTLHGHMWKEIQADLEKMKKTI
jgi:DNA-directed RNA polymerase subunit RPC12/RpoP